MANNQDLDKVLKKLRKLQNLYEGAKAINSEGEAANAAFLIQKLLTEYNLTMDQIGVEPEEDPILQEFTSGFTYKSIGGEWEMRLLYVLCKHNFCRCFVYGRSVKQLLLIGKKEWLRSMLSERYVQFSKEKYKEYLASVPLCVKPMSKDKYQRGYLMGCAAGLDSKLTAESERDKKQDEEFSTKVTALVIGNNAALDEYVAEKFGKTGSRKGSCINSAQAYNSGYEDGKNTEIYKPIAQSHRKNSESVQLLK